MKKSTPVSGGRERSLRLLAVQTNRWECAEVDVFAALTRRTSEAYGIRILLIQGVDETTSLPHMPRAPASSLFAQIAAVEIVPLDLGHLGRTEGGAFAKILSLLRLAGQMPRLLARANAWKPDVVYSAQQVWDIYLAALLARILRRPRVTHLHFPIGPWLGKGVTPLLRSASFVLCVSDFIRRYVIDIGVPSARTRTIYNSLLPKYRLDQDRREETRRRLRLSLGLADSAQIVIMVAAINEQKDQAALIEAFALILEACSDANLILAGEAESGAHDYADRLERRVFESSLRNRVHFLGFRRDVPNLLAACDIFAHPSHFDALPNAVQEASCAGLPVVAWNEGGVAEIVQHGVTGLLAETGDVRGLADCLQRLLQDSALAVEMGRNGQDRVSRVFNVETAAADFHEALRSVT